MSYECIGRQPTAKEGESFHVAIWRWKPIHDLMCELCHDLLGDKLLRAMSFNDGAGPKSQMVCTEMANRFDRWMEHNAAGLVVDGPLVEVGERGELKSKGEAIGDPSARSPYAISDGRLKEWIVFLRSCGGFEVW
jgi:hypothetical protein